MFQAERRVNAAREQRAPLDAGVLTPVMYKNTQSKRLKEPIPYWKMSPVKVKVTFENTT